MEEVLPPEVVMCILRAVDRLTWPCCRLVCHRWNELTVRLAQRSPRRDDRAPPQYCMLLAREGRLRQLQWARANGAPWDEYTCANAARNGHLAVLQWARAHGCPWNRDVCAWAAGGGHLEVLQWARLNGCPWDYLTCTYAARGGHLAVLQWARANGCAWNESTILAAAEGGQLEVLRWADEHGCPWIGIFHEVIKRAREAGHAHVATWLADSCYSKVYDHDVARERPGLDHQEHFVLSRQM